MAIRFQCSACTQPIEVDDEWASKVVACPYCSKTVTAPAESSIPSAHDIPVAAKLQDPNTPANLASPLAGRRNRAALAAFVLALLQIMFVMISMQIQSAHRFEIEELSEALMRAGDFSKMLEVYTAFFESHGGQPPAWMATMSALFFLEAANWIAILICGIIGVRRPHRRGLAIFALVVAGLFPIMLCCGGFLPSPSS